MPSFPVDWLRKDVDPFSAVKRGRGRGVLCQLILIYRKACDSSLYVIPSQSTAFDNNIFLTLGTKTIAPSICDTFVHAIGRLVGIRAFWSIALLILNLLVSWESIESDQLTKKTSTGSHD